MWKEVEGRWKQFTGEAKVRWAKLTDNDFKECEGDRDKLVGKLQTLYGMSADEAGEEIAQIERRLHEAEAGGERLYGGNTG